MPLNYLELQPGIRAYAQHAAAALKESEDQRRQMLDWLRECASAPMEDVRGRCQALVGERCGLPAGEISDQSFEPAAAPACTLLAADGSQIIPSSHDPVPLALINIGLISLDTAGGQAPRVTTTSTILDQFAPGTEFELMSEDLVSLKRDVAELQAILQYESKNRLPVVALRDGPLELFHEPRQSEHFESEFAGYLAAMVQLAKRDVGLAGYIDRSQSTTITQMLHIFKQGAASKNLLPDVRLMEAFLPAGRRSAVFELQSPSSAHYAGELRLHFFYLNVGRREKASIVRVEIPAWVARDAQRVAQLHSLLLEQCTLLGSRPYPYVLHRAHETAVVRFEEKEQLQQALQIELHNNGVDAPQASNKLAAKELPTRTRM